MGVTEAAVTLVERTPRKCDCCMIRRRCTRCLVTRISGLVPVVAPAERCGLSVLVRRHVRITARTGVNADLKARTCGIHLQPGPFTLRPAVPLFYR